MAIRTANNQSLTEITALPSVVTVGSLVLLETQTASGDGTIDFTSNIDSTYKEYIFKFIDIHPEETEKEFGVQFNLSVDSGDNYNVAKTTTWFVAYHDEADTATRLAYLPVSSDLAQGTGAQPLNVTLDADNDSCLVGQLHLYDPSNTTFVKHFIARTQEVLYDSTSQEVYVAGYCNVTAAIDGVQFSMSSGNIDAGTFKMYGVT